ncbi:cadherin-like protein 26 [Antennarius striatus]|uniref:cadherin-like protein 26 n=1 Tax=Antennarius striatus TaxID=241820 RepID=UPI0035AE28F1
MAKIWLCFFIVMFLGVHRSSSKTSQRQKRNWIIDSFPIFEGYNGTFPYSLGTINIEKKLGMFEILGQGADEEPKGVLQIDKHTGELSVHRPVDYEEFSVLKLILLAYNTENLLVETRLGIEILIIDANDNPPKFDRDTYEINVEESTLQGTNLIVITANDVDSVEGNKMFDMKIVSVTPKSQDLEFYLKNTNHVETGIISFKGCLDHEKAETYTVIVEAKDHGEEQQLSSSCTVIINIEDGNNHIPEITGQTGSGKVKEGEDHVLVSRLQVTDEDKKGSPAWRAKYRIEEGDDKNNFMISTDPETNEGLLYVEKHLNYEDIQTKSVTVVVENEIPYHSCKVVSRRADGLWKVVTSSRTTGMERSYVTSQRVTVTVEDVNEPPVFDVAQKHVTLSENIKGGQDLATFMATDPDVRSTNTVVYVKGKDPADWVTVDHVTGRITTSKAFDRESHFVKDNIYNITVYAVDNGQPPMTSTAALSIHVIDVNDNAPTLNVSSVIVCQGDGPSGANIPAVDLDEEPYGGPFHFKLLGDVAGWRLDPNQGYSANLVKDDSVHSGHLELTLEVSDLQDNKAVHNLSVSVCRCSDPTKPSCNSPKSSSLGDVAVWIICFSIILLAGVLLLAALLSCKAEKTFLSDEDSGQHLMISNTETPGTDCEVGVLRSNQRYSLRGKHHQHTSDVSVITQQPLFNTTTAAAAEWKAYSAYDVFQNEQQQGNHSYQNASNQHWRNGVMGHGFSQGVSMYQSLGSSWDARRSLDGNYEHRVPESLRTSDNVQRQMEWNGYFSEELRDIQLKVLNKMLLSLQAPGEELCDYAPHVYAEEGPLEGSYDLDAIPIPEVRFDWGLHLNSKFSALASTCMPSKGTTFSKTGTL